MMHHPMLATLRVKSVNVEPAYITEFTGLKVKFDWDCTPGTDKEGFNYFSVVPSRRFKCREHARILQKGSKLYIPDLPIADDEYSQWTAVVESIQAAPPHDEYVYVELGARWGTWVTRAATYSRMLRPDLKFFGWAVEASAEYVANMEHTVAKNGLQEQITISHALATPELLKKFLSGTKYVDLLDSDIQGSEFDLLADDSVFQLLQEKVKRLQIGTHDNSKHLALRQRLESAGWICIEDELGRATDACDRLIAEDKYVQAVLENCTIDSDIGPLYVRDGALSMINPKFKALRYLR
jgi:hypothetical protein